LKARTTVGVEAAADKADITVGGIVRVLKKKNVKSTGDMMAIITLEDGEGSIEVIVFSELFKSVNGHLKKDALLLVKGSVDRDEKGVRLRAKEVLPLEGAGKAVSPRRVEIVISGNGSSEGLRKIRDVVMQYPGDCQFYLRISRGPAETVIASGIGISPDDGLISALEEMVGREGVTVS
jgi:DNA polymerase-3 subunit alpha